MSKNLKVIQTIAKVAEIVTKVLFVLCIVGAAGCLAGASAIFGVSVLNILDKSVLDIIIDTDGVDLNSACLSCTVGFIVCVSEAVVLGFAANYLKRELADGTPFTYDGAKKLLTLGIVTSAVSLGSAILTETTTKVFTTFYPDATASASDPSSAIIIGLSLIALSFVFKYGAELRECKEQENGSDKKQ